MQSGPPAKAPFSRKEDRCGFQALLSAPISKPAARAIKSRGLRHAGQHRAPGALPQYFPRPPQRPAVGARSAGDQVQRALPRRTASPTRRAPTVFPPPFAAPRCGSPPCGRSSPEGSATPSSIARKARSHSVLPQASSASFSSCLPRFLPVNNRVSVAGMFSKPSCTSSSWINSPDSIQPRISFTASPKRGR